MAAPAVTNTFVNGTTADATEVNQNFTDVINGITDGTKDLTISALTVNGAAVFNANVTLGNATGDDITFTGRVASDIDPKTAASNDLGDSTQTWRALYLDNTTNDSGTIYFDSGTTYYLQGNTAVLDVVGFTSLDLNTTADVVGTLHYYAAVNNGTIYDEGDPVYSFTGDTDTGMYSEGANQLNFSAGGTEMMAMTSAGVIVNEAGNAGTDFRVESTGHAHALFVDGGNDAVGIMQSAPNDYLDGSAYGLIIGGDTGGAGSGTDHRSVLVINGYNNANNEPLGWINFSNEESGNLTNKRGARIKGVCASANADHIKMSFSATNSSGAEQSSIMEIWDSGVGVAKSTSPAHAIDVTGTAGLSTGTAWTNTSDERLKDVHGKYEYGLKEIEQIEVVRFNYKEGNALELPHEIDRVGVVAQQVKPIIPDAITTRPADDYLELNADPVWFAMLTSIQELSAQNKDMRLEIAALKSAMKEA